MISFVDPTMVNIILSFRDSLDTETGLVITGDYLQRKFNAAVDDGTLTTLCKF